MPGSEKAIVGREIEVFGNECQSYPVYFHLRIWLSIDELVDLRVEKQKRKFETRSYVPNRIWFFWNIVDRTKICERENKSSNFSSDDNFCPEIKNEMNVKEEKKALHKHRFREEKTIFSIPVLRNDNRNMLMEQAGFCLFRKSEVYKVPFSSHFQHQTFFNRSRHFNFFFIKNTSTKWSK